ncbi:MAG: S8 family serine peptidase, partial [Planctomycetota bacterium JB042]
GVLFERATHAEDARATLAALPFVSAEDASRAPYAAGHLMFVETSGSPTADEVVAAMRALDETPGVLAAGPRFVHGDETYFVTDEVLVRWREGVDAAVVADLEVQHGLTRSGTLDYLVNPGVVYRVPAGRSLDAMAITRALSATGEVEFAHPDFSIVRVPCAATNDPLFPNQWHLNSTGQNGAKPDADVNAPEAWDVTRGDPNLVIAVVDTGCELGHPDLAPNLVQGTDVLSDDSNPQAENGFLGLFPENHSTSVCGIAAGRGDNGIGTTGAAQHCRIMPIRFLSEFLFPAPTIQDEADAFNFAVANGAAVINNSWGPLGAAALAASTKAAIDNAVNNGRGGLGTMVFFAAGNSSVNTAGNQYVEYAHTIAVSSSTDQDLFASYSNFGAGVDFCAPSNGGVTSGTWTTDRLGSTGYSSGDYTGAFGGTSSASPLAAGVALLVLSANPALTWTEARQILRDTAKKIDPAGGAYDAGGHSLLYGHGKVDAAAAVAAASATGIAFYGAPWPGSGGQIPLIGAAGGAAQIGNAGFAVTLANARPSVTAGLLIGFAPASVPFGGGTVLVNLSHGLVVTFPTGPGSLNVPAPIPNDSNLIGAKANLQWVVADPGAVGGYAMTEGMELTFQP